MRHIYKTTILLAFGFWLLAFGAKKLSGQEAVITANPPSPACISEIIEFEGTTTLAGTVTYTFDFGVDSSPADYSEANSSSVASVNVTYSSAGDKTIVLTTFDGIDTYSSTLSYTINANNTVTGASSTPTLCINTPLTAITHSTTGATGIGAPIGLPTGVTAVWAANTITISGTPSASGPFSYSIPLTGGCGTVTATGTITVTPNNTVSLTSASGTDSQALCINTPITNITYATTGATGATITGLPGGVNGSWASNIVTISGSPNISGPFEYTILLTGGCGTVSTTGTINVTPNNTVSLTSASGTNSQSLCINIPITNITYATTGATGATITGLPTGVNGSWLGNIVTISGTPSVAGNFNYQVSLTGGCGTITATGSINVIANPISSVAITSSESTVCIGTTVNYTAIPTNGGASPSYQWKVNGTNIGPNLSTFSYTPNNGDNVWVVMTSSLACALPVNSNTMTMTVVSSITPSLSISGNNNICLGSTSTFTATPVSAGNNPTFTWYVNNVVQSGHTTSTFTYVPANNDQVRATVLSSACSGGTANSNVITMIVNPILPTSVSISSATEVCANVEVLYTAIPVNGGASPVYQWFVNDVSVASPGFQFTYIPSNEDEIVVHMTSSLSCVTSSTVISPLITMTVDPIMPVSVTITASDPDLQICQNTPVTFTANPVNGGLAPNFQWKVNNNNQGTNSNIFTYNPSNNDVITVVLTSDEICTSGNPATSNALQMTVAEQLVVGVGLVVSENNICEGENVIFTATPYNGGSAPMYQWKVGGVNVGPLTVSNTFSYTPTNGQQISVAMTSNETCVVNQNVTSDVITMIVNPLVVPSVNIFATNTEICEGEPMAFSALVTNGGATPAFQWKLNGVNTGPNNPVYSFIPPVGTHTITVQVTSSLACVTSTTVTATPLSFVVDAKLPVSVSIQSNDTTVCAGTAVTFTALTQNPGTTPGFTWKVNGGTISGAASNTYTYAPADNDQVWVVLASSETCSSGNPATSTPIVMDVLPTPSVNLTFTQGTSSACIGDSIKMTTVYNLAYLYTWFVDNIQVKTGQGLNANNYAFKLNQTKTVRVEVKLGACIVENSQTVIANPLPVIQITASDPQICEGDPVTLTLTGISGTTWHWINPDYVLNYTPITIYPETGVQVFSAEATNFFGCVNTATATVEVIAKPVVDIVAVGGQFACTNAPKSFTATQNSNFTYKWFVNDQLQVGAISHTFADTLTGVSAVEVKVQATNTITGCYNSDSTYITPIVSPTLIMTPTDTELCPGEQTFITLSSATAPPVYYAWGDGLQGNVLTRGFIPTTDTLVWAEAINPTGCITRDTLYISVNPAPVAQINNPAQTVVCEGQTVTLTTSVLANHQYKWMVEGDSIASGATFAFVALQTTEVVLVVKNQYGCEETDTLTITVEDAPNVDLGADVAVCTNYTYTLTGPQNENYTYKWYVNNQLIANNTFEYSFKVTQAVTVRLEVKVGNCTTTDQIVITPLAVPVVNVTANNAAICFGQPVVLSLSTQNASSYVWWDAFTGLTTRTVVPVENDTTLAYWAEAINSLGCKSRDTVLVRVNPLPSVPLTVSGGSNIVCYNAVATVQGPQVAGHQYEWFIDDVATGTNTYQLSFTVTKDVTVKLQVTDVNGCENTNQIAIQSRNLPGILLNPDSLEVCLGNSFTLAINNQNVNSYSWFDGLAGNLLQRTFVATTTGSFTYWVEGTNSFGCVSRDTAIITVRPAPVAQINNPAQTVVCEGQTVTLTTSVLANHQYKWMVEGDSLASGATFAFVALQTTEVVLVVKNQYGCEETDTLTITVEDAPNVDLGANVSVCTNYTYTLTGPQNENYTYKWYVNNQLIANNTFEYSFIVTQAVTVRLEVKVGNCTTTDQIVITPLEVPVINVTANNAAICFGEPVVLSLSTQNASSYVWWDAFTGLTTRTIVPVENDTILAYWAEAINSLGCKSRDTVLVRVNPLPSVPLTVAGGSNIVCYNAVATVQGPQVSGHQYEWFIDDVATGTNTYQLSFTVTKDVTVKLHLTDANGCENTNQIAIQSRNLPGILLSPDSLDVCLGNSFTLSINNQNVNSYSWFDGLAGNLLQRTFEATTTGSFIYWVEGINSFGCVSRDTAFITVNALPDIFILAPGGTTVCQGEEITLVGSGQEDDIYEWYVNGLLVNNTSTYTFVADQTTDVSLIVTNVAGCQQTDIITINVLDAPEVDLGADLQVCEGYVLTFTGPLDAAHSYGWYINNTLMSTDSSYSFVVSGNISLRLDVTSPDGCSASDTLAITTLPSPAINVTPDNSEFCLGETATLSLTTNGSSYIWWDGLGTNVPTRSFTPTIGDSTYAYWAEAVNSIGCTSRDTAYVKVNNHPVIDIAIQGLANTFCFGSQATIVGPSVEGYTYQWYVNGLEAGENSDRLIFAVTSESLVKLEVTDANGCFGADSLTVFMHTAPGILLSPDSLDICIGQSFTLTIDPINVLSFAWWDGLAGNQTNRTITPTVPDMTYIYWAQGINSIGCISFDTAYITVHSLPAAVLLTPLGTSICQGETMILQTPVEEGYTYEWIVDGETLSTEAQLEFVAETSVSVTLIVTNEFNCSTSETVEIEVFITPFIAFGDDIFACLNEKVVVAGPIGTGFSYEWLLNGVNTGVTSPTFEYEVVDTVSIVLNMNTTNGCVASDTIVITPLLTPKVTIDASADAFCLGESVTLTASLVDAVAFEWWDGFTNPVRIITPETSGITHYWAEVTSAANCVSRDSISLIVHPNPEIQLVIFEGTPEVCEGGSLTFAVSDNAGIEIDYVVWDKEVTVPMGDEPVLYFEKVFNESSWFFAEMFSINGCSVSDSIFVIVEPLPEMTISNDTTVCSGETVKLESTGGILCIWSDETGMVGAGYTLEIQAAETKTYYATIIGDGNLGCSQTDSVTVTVYPLPEVMVQASQQNVCGGTPIVLVASGADSYVWSTGQTGTVITVYPLQTTTYSVTGINESGCSEVALVTVNIIPTPVVTLVGLEEFYCTTAEPAVLTGSPAGGIYSGGIGVIGGKFYPSIAGQGVHQVVYSYVNSFGCTGSDTLQTTVVGITEAINLGENTIICPHEEVVFDAGPGYQKYFWSTGDTTRTTTISGNTYFAGTTRTITVIATIQECSVMGSVELTIRNDCYIGIDEIETKEDMVLIPNPSRGEFIIQHKGGEGELQVSIFDGRSGNVYAGTFETCSEDGRQCKVDLSHLPKGVYMVSIIRGDRRFVRKMVIM